MSAQSLWHNAPELQSDAIFIADAHFMPLHLEPLPSQGKIASRALLAYFHSLLQNKAHIPSQIFLMGDIAHLLLGGIPSSIEAHKQLLDSLHQLTKHSQIWWLEGNHDFGLSHAMESMARFYPALRAVRIIPRSQQPLPLNYIHKDTAYLESKKILLAHGDIFLNKKYEMYIALMTTHFMRLSLRMLDYVTFGNLYKCVVKKVNHNTIKQGNVDIQTFAEKRIAAYNTYLHNAITQGRANKQDKIDMIIEGHFHIGKSYNGQSLYISLPSFYLNGSVFTIQSKDTNHQTHTISD